MAAPKPAGAGRRASRSSITKRPLTPKKSKGALSIYTDFLSTYSEAISPTSPQTDELENDPSTSTAYSKEVPEVSTMAAILDQNNPASPLHYRTSQTALLLLDFQNFTIDHCGPAGQAALAKAKDLLDWARKHDIVIIHSIVDVKGTPRPTTKGFERLTKMLPNISSNPSSAAQPADVAFSPNRDNEFLVLKQPGTVSGLKSGGAMELLQDHGIRSLLIAGLSTSGAVLRTAVPATDDGFVVTVVKDACADPKAAVHEVLFESVLPSRAHVVTLGELTGASAAAAGS
jgi:nicotinamidase-related amidase